MTLSEEALSLIDLEFTESSVLEGAQKDNQVHLLSEWPIQGLNL